MPTRRYRSRLSWSAQSEDYSFVLCRIATIIINFGQVCWRQQMPSSWRAIRTDSRNFSFTHCSISGLSLEPVYVYLLRHLPFCCGSSGGYLPSINILVLRQVQTWSAVSRNGLATDTGTYTCTWLQIPSIRNSISTSRTTGTCSIT